MKRTKAVIASAMLLASLGLSFVPTAFPAVTTSASAAQDQIWYTYNAQTDTVTFSGIGIVTQEILLTSLEGRNSVDTVILSDGVTGICDSGNITIQKVVLGKDVTSCEAYVTEAYQLSNRNSAFSVFDDALYSKDFTTLLRVPTQKNNLSYPEALQTIGVYAFYGNNADMIIVPWGVTTILEGGLCSNGWIKIIPDTIIHFDTPSSYRYPSDVYLWEGENKVIENAAGVYAANDIKSLADALLSVWNCFGTRKISAICKGEQKSPDAGWYSLAGQSLYFEKDGKFLTSWQQVNGKWYSFMDCGIMRTGLWTLEESYTDKLGSGLTYCFDKNGVLMTSTTYTDPYYDKSYLIDEMGVVDAESPDEQKLQSGFVTEGGNTYYYVEGQRVLGSYSIDDKVYYFGDDGIMQHSKWVQIYGNWFYLNDYGAGVVNCWRLKDGKYVYLNATGRMLMNEWVKDYGYWYYVKADGSRYESSWAKIGGVWYWFGGSGKMAQSQWLKLADGEWYYFHSSGAMAANQWVNTEGKWYYLGSSGAMVTNKWAKSGGYWYYLGSDGAMLTNTTTPDGYWVDAYGRWK